MSHPPHRVALIVNPTAGKGAGRRLGETTRAALVARGHEVLDVSGVDYASAREHAGRALADGAETLGVEEKLVAEIGGVVGSHVGLGAYGVAHL